MSGIERRLTKLEAASGHTAQTVVVFVSFVPGRARFARYSNR